MSEIIRWFKYLIFIPGLLFLVPSLSGQTKPRNWSFKTRIQQGFEFDSNIEEEQLNPVSDYLFKLVCNTQFKMVSKNYLTQFEYHGGIQRYFQTPNEHKMIHDFHALGIYKCSKRIRIGNRLWGRFKYFNQRDWQYWSAKLEPFILINLPLFQFTFRYQIETLDHLNYNQFDFKGHQFNFIIDKQLSRYISTRLSAGQQNIHYQMYALIYKPFLDVLFFTKYLHEDKKNFISIQSNYKRNFLCYLKYLYQRNLSNSYGFAYRHHRITFSFTTSVGKSSYLRLFTGFQHKKYDIDLKKIIITQLDTEREISNFLIIDWSRNISLDLNLLLRCSWFDNESPIPGLYYQKLLFSCSFEYRF